MATLDDILTTQKNGVVAINALTDSVNIFRKRITGQYRSLTVSSRTEIARGPGILIAYTVTVAGAAGWIYDSILPITTLLQGGVPAPGSVTVNYRPDYSFAVGDTVIVENTICDNGGAPLGYNGTYVVTAATANTVTFASAQTGNQTQAGTVFNQKAANRITATAASVATVQIGAPFTTGLVVEPGAGQSLNVIYSLD
jgi:hypothetical protein